MDFKVADFEHGGFRGAEFDEGRFSCRHFYHRAADAPYVGGRPVPAKTAVDHLRSHVLERTCVERG